MNNPTLNYQSLLAATDKEAKQNYDHVDPRVALYATRNNAEGSRAASFSSRKQVQASLQEETSNQIAIDPEKYIDSLAVPVQNQPEMTEKTTVVIIDSAQRDWTIQPDSLFNVFSFINPNVGPSTQIPYYYNNSNIPFSAYDMPDPAGGYYIRNAPVFIPNNQARTINPSDGGIITINQPFQNNGMLAQTWGWRIVISASTGQIKHYSESNPATYIQPNDRVVYYPVYDSKRGRGQLLGTDSLPNIQGVQKTGFGTQLVLSNITSMKLARATLPIRRFDSYDPRIFGGANVNFTEGNVLNTFHNEPYILMSINNLTGQYYGAGPVIHNSFTALVQQQRTLVDSTNSSVYAQFQDFYPWSGEAYTFDPPLSQLSNAVISLSNSFGQQYTHLDDLNVTTMIFGDKVNPSDGKQLGVISFLITRDRTNATIDIRGSNCNWYFASNDVRPGDQIIFYPGILSKIQTDPSISPALSNLMNYFQTNGAIVTNVSIIDNSSIPILDVGYTFDAVVNTRNVNEIFDLYNNCITPIVQSPDVPTFIGVQGELSQFNGMKYISLCASNTIISPTIGSITLSDVLSPAAYYPLPVLNRNCQTTYAFEIITSEADTSTLKKIIPN